MHPNQTKRPILLDSILSSTLTTISDIADVTEDPLLDTFIIDMLENNIEEVHISTDGDEISLLFSNVYRYSLFVNSDSDGMQVTWVSVSSPILDTTKMTLHPSYEALEAMVHAIPQEVYEELYQYLISNEDYSTPDDDVINNKLMNIIRTQLGEQTKD